MVVITPLTTFALSTAYTSAYLSSIYLLPSTRIDYSTRQPATAPSISDPPPQPDQTLADSVPAAPPRDRNHPEVIRARLTGVSISTLISCISLRYVLPSSPHSTAPSLVRLLGLGLPKRPLELVNLVALPMGLTATLFLGSLYIMALDEELPGQHRWSWKQLKKDFNGLQGLRTYVIGPLSEELVFRSCIIAVSALGGMSKKQIIFLTPLYFGLAHVHHAWEAYVAGGRTSAALKRGVLTSAFQFAYTTLFGWYASFVYMRTGSVIPPFLIHSFCNSMGLPPLGWALQAFPDRKMSLWASYATGIAGFVYGFWRWTEPSFFGGSIYWPV